MSGCAFGEPSHEIIQTFVDVVDVESGDLQWPGLKKDHSALTRASQCKYFLLRMEAFSG